MIIHGDCLDVLKTLEPDSIDAVVTDPPYGLVFMNKHWDAQVPTKELWSEVFRVLKPGAHVLSFGGTRTYHRMASAIEDAGFEIRDQLQWLFGSGFPKSSRVNRDQAFCQCASFVRNGVSTGLSRPQVDHTDTEADVSGDGLPQLNELHCSDKGKGSLDGCRQDRDSNGELLQADESLDQASIPLQECVRVRNRSVVLGDDQADESSRNLSSVQCSAHPSSQDCSTRSESDVDISRGTPLSKEQSANTSTRTDSVLSGSRKSRTTSQSSASHKIDSLISKCQECGNPVADGLGTALKPANEPIVLARKPLAESTVAKNVLRYGTGALNIDASRIGTETVTTWVAKNGAASKFGQVPFSLESKCPTYHHAGRWPSNVILGCDCGDDGQLALIHQDDCAVAELDRQSGDLGKSSSGSRRQIGTHDWAGANKSQKGDCGFGDTGGASRFFYVSKTSKRERNAGLDSYECIRSDELCKGEATVAVQLLQKVISVSTARWSTGESGNRITVLFPKECRSTIATEISKTIGSKILNCLPHLIINANIQDALSEEDIGLNHVASVESLKAWLLNTTNDSTELALGAVSAASTMLSKISESENSPFVNGHATVKPIKLMEYLIRLITPPAGKVLDPFAGSGSTGVAAIRLGFDFVGIEREADYVEIAERRIAHAKGLTHGT